MPNLVPPRNAFAEFKTKRIPNAAFWSVDVIATKDEGPVKLQHMLPTPEMFADACCELLRCGSGRGRELMLSMQRGWGSSALRMLWCTILQACSLLLARRSRSRFVPSPGPAILADHLSQAFGHPKCAS